MQKETRRENGGAFVSFRRPKLENAESKDIVQRTADPTALITRREFDVTKQVHKAHQSKTKTVEDTTLQVPKTSALQKGGL